MEPILKGIKVLELATVLAGPSVGMFLAELGADVIKIESTLSKGDVTRSWFIKGEDRNINAAYFNAVNWGKRSIALNISNTQAYNTLVKLVKQADIVIAAYRPGVSKKLKVDYQNLKKIKPDLIYAEVSGYGGEDSRPAYDAIIQAESGLMSMNGYPNAKPLKMPVAMTDVLAGHQLKEGVLLALLKKERSGEGSCVRVSLLDAAIVSLVNQAANYLKTGQVPQPMGSGHPNIVPYGEVYKTKDGKYIVIAIGTDKQFAALCHCLKIDLATNPAYKDNYNRVLNREKLNKILESVFLKQMSKTVIQDFMQYSVPAGQVKNLKEVFQMKEAQALELEKAGSMQALRSVAFETDFYKKSSLREPPLYGQHSLEILNELGINGEKLNELVHKNVVNIVNLS